MQNPYEPPSMNPKRRRDARNFLLMFIVAVAIALAVVIPLAYFIEAWWIKKTNREIEERQWEEPLNCRDREAEVLSYLGGPAQCRFHIGRELED